jgi:predicted ATPase/DNA-binding CsgD family transcriptional regulator
VHLLLGAAPGLRILATSRHVLGVPGEHVVDVPPLSLPEPDVSPLATGDTYHHAESYDAIRLFTERATAVRPGFQITADNYPAVAGICTVLEGVPLAIEMAARRMQALSAEEILSRLDDRFTLLTGSTVASKRHRSLLATIDWSFDLCSPREQLLWTRLSVFSRGFDLAAAEDVAAGGTIAREHVVDLVAGLVEKSVLARQKYDPDTRYTMLDSVRDYGRARLSREDDAELRRRHRDWYHRLAARFAQEWFGPHQTDWCARLRDEHANLLVALDFCRTEPGTRQAGLAMVTDLWSYWLTHGSVREGHRRLTLALAAAPEQTSLRAKALWLTGWMAQLSGAAAAPAVLDECRAIAERLGDRSAMAHLVHLSGYAAMSAGDHAAALARYEDALARHRALGDEAGVTTVLVELALCHCLQGDLDRAVALCADSVRRSTAHGETWCRSGARYVQGMVLWRRGGQDQDAERVARESIRLKRDLDDVLGIGMGLELLAWITAADGAHQRAARLTGTARRIWRAVGTPLGGIHQLLRYREHAERQMTEALGMPGFEAARQVGANLTVDEVLSYHDISTVQTAQPRCRPSPDYSGPRLTSREWQVAELVAQGMTNRDIAASLGIVQRTAEAHVQHILTKLGFTSRARLAAWVVEQSGAESS